MKDLILNHIKHDDYLEQEDVMSILNKNSTLMFEGKAYRLLMFSNPTEDQSVIGDASFAKSLKGVKYYSEKQDADYYKEVHLYESELVGLDLIKAVDHFKCEAPREMIINEDEVIAGSVSSSKLLFKGSWEDFDQYILSNI